MSNPYAPPPLTTSTPKNFDVVATIRSTRTFLKVGLVTGVTAGCVFEITLRWLGNMPLMWMLLPPGLILGMGVFAATRAAVPQARTWGLWLFPSVATFSFAQIGAMYQVGLQDRSAWLSWWLLLCRLSVPGVLTLALGCLLVAPPKSYFRFATFVLITLGVVGAAPLVVDALAGSYQVVPILLVTMFVVQSTIFAMIGWIFGDTVDGTRQSADHQDRPSARLLDV